MMKNAIIAVTKIPIWGLITITAMILCADIELKLLLIPCCSEYLATAVNHIVLALSYSYIAAAIFHYVVNVIPYNKRKHMIEPYLRSQIWRIQDKIRLCKETVTPFTSVFGIEYSKKEFSQKFADANLFEDYYLGNGKSKLMQLDEIRESIIDISVNVLSYREFLDDKYFQYINKVVNSSFISNGIYPCPDVDMKERISYDSNQYEIGECIYDLYEYSKMIKQ